MLRFDKQISLKQLRCAKAVAQVSNTVWSKFFSFNVIIALLVQIDALVTLFGYI